MKLTQLCKSGLLSAICCLSLTGFSPVLAANEVKQVYTTGQGDLAIGVSQAREEAIRQATRLAVEQAMGVYVLSETLTENMALVSDKILTQSSGYISGYKVVSESKANGLYTVKIEATVSVEPLVDQLAALGLLRDWNVAVVLVSNGDARTSNESAKTQLNAMMIKKGFRVADDNALVQLSQPALMQQIQQGNYLAALPALRDQGVDVLVVGKTLTRAAGEPMETYGGIKTIMTQGQIDARLIRVDTGEMLAAKSFNAAAGGSAQDIAESKAIQQAAQKAGDFFALEIAKLPAATTQKILLSVKGLNYNRERSLREALKTVPGIRKLNRLIYRNLVAQYEITFGGKSDDLAEALATSAALKGYGFEIQGVSAGKIEAKAK